MCKITAIHFFTLLKFKLKSFADVTNVKMHSVLLPPNYLVTTYLIEFLGQELG